MRSCALPLAAGVIVANAHRVTDSSGEGFAVRLYRQGRHNNPWAPPPGSHAPGLRGNATGFVRAFSDVAPAMAGGFSKVRWWPG